MPRWSVNRNKPIPNKEVVGLLQHSDRQTDRSKTSHLEQWYLHSPEWRTAPHTGSEPRQQTEELALRPAAEEKVRTCISCECMKNWRQNWGCLKIQFLHFCKTLFCPYIIKTVCMENTGDKVPLNWGVAWPLLLLFFFLHINKIIPKYTGIEVGFACILTQPQN